MTKNDFKDFWEEREHEAKGEHKAIVVAVMWHITYERQQINEEKRQKYGFTRNQPNVVRHQIGWAS